MRGKSQRRESGNLQMTSSVIGRLCRHKVRLQGTQQEVVSGSYRTEQGFQQAEDAGQTQAAKLARKALVTTSGFSLRPPPRSRGKTEIDQPPKKTYFPSSAGRKPGSLWKKIHHFKPLQTFIYNVWHLINMYEVA